MQVTVSNVYGVDVGTCISIRAGSARRQAQLPLEQPFSFPVLPLNANPFQIDLLKPIGSHRLSISTAALESYSVKMEDVAGRSMVMDLQVQEIPSLCGCNVTDEYSKIGAQQEDPRQREMAAETARAYLERFRLLDFVRELMQYIIREKPEDPYAFMADYLYRTSAAARACPQTAASQTDLEQPPAPANGGIEDPISAHIARQNDRLDAENERLRVEIEQLRRFCEHKGLAPLIEDPAIALPVAAYDGVPNTHHYDALAGKNAQLRREHEDLQRTLVDFSKGFNELAGRLSAFSGQAAPPPLAQIPQSQAIMRPCPPEDVQRVEMQTATENARLELENNELMQQIEVLMRQAATANNGAAT